MNKNRAVRFFGGAAAMAAAGVAVLAMSVTAHGLENGISHEATPTQFIHQAEPRIRVAQAATTPASYTDEQADRGQEDFEDHCSECHGDDLRGGLNGGPPLRGLAFEEKYFSGAPASGLFLFMSTLMPPDSPGRFSPSVYADIMAYILKRNGVRAGSEELPADEAALDNLILQK